MKRKPAKKGEWVVFFDFDNTISCRDVLYDIIVRFSIDERWRSLEDAWRDGRIGSRECLTGQLESIRASKDELTDYLAKVPIDPQFQPLLALLDMRNIPVMITSDSFSFLIETVLRHHGIVGIPIYANEVAFDGSRLLPSFPFHSPDCPRCAHCKKRHVLANADRTTVYVGDGISDICPAEHADLVFAKDSLLAHFRTTGRDCRTFRDLGDVAGFFNHLPYPAATSAV